MEFEIRSSNSTAVSSGGLITSVPAAPEAQAATAAPTLHAADTVKLSLSARVHALHSQGQSARQISTSLGLSPQMISTYLGAVAKPVAAAVQPAAAASAPVAEASKPVS